VVVVVVVVVVKSAMVVGMARYDVMLLGNFFV